MEMRLFSKKISTWLCCIFPAGWLGFDQAITQWTIPFNQLSKFLFRVQQNPIYWMPYQQVSGQNEHCFWVKKSQRAPPENLSPYWSFSKISHPCWSANGTPRHMSLPNGCGSDWHDNDPVDRSSTIDHPDNRFANMYQSCHQLPEKQYWAVSYTHLTLPTKRIV